MTLTNSFSLSCSEGFLGKAFEDIKSSQVLFANKLNEPAIYHLQQANEKIYKSVRCMLSYLIVEVPLKITKLIHKCIDDFNNKKEKNVFDQIEIYLEQKKLKDPNQLNSLFKKTYSHDIRRGLKTELDRVRELYKDSLNNISNIIRVEMPKLAEFLENIIGTLMDQLLKRIENIVQQYELNSSTSGISEICSLHAAEDILTKDEVLEASVIKKLKELKIYDDKTKEYIRKLIKFMMIIFTTLLINMYINRLGDIRYPNFDNQESHNTLKEEIVSNFNCLLSATEKNYSKAEAALNILRTFEQGINAYQCSSKLKYEQFKKDLENISEYIIKKFEKLSSNIDLRGEISI